MIHHEDHEELEGTDFVPKFLAGHPDLAIPPEDCRRFIEPCESRGRILMRGGNGEDWRG